MSLQVWLPFTDNNFKQQGLSPVVCTKNGTVTTGVSGKLGKCVKFGTAAGGLTLPTSCMTSFTECSVAFWLKIEAWNTQWETYFQAGTGSTPWNNYIFGLLRNGNASNICFTLTNSSSGTTSASYTTSDLETGVWYHLAFTYQSGKVCCYRNGQLDKEYTTSYVPNFAGITKITIGRCNNETSYQTNCCMNDFRIYNHCLSQSQVKELSKGLVLHYLLNRKGWGQENLHKNSDTITSTWSVNQGTVSNGIVTLSPTTNSDRRIYQMPTNGAWSWQSGKIYTASIDAKSSMGAILGFYPYGAGSMTQAYTVTSEWKRYSFTFTATQSGTASMTYQVNQTSGVTLQLRHPKLEEGSIATPWCPNSSDALATIMNLNGTTEYDCSGFCNNGTFWAYDTGGAITYTSNTPKHQVSTYINSDNNTTNTASGSRYIYGNCELTAPQYLTVAFWCKPIAGYGNSTGQGQFSLTNYAIGAAAGQDYDTAPMNHRDSVVDMCTSSGTHKYVSIAFTANEWHHYAIVYDGRYGRVYKDGVATGAVLDMGSVLPLKDMKGAVIGFSKAGGVWRSNKSYYSDFRIYTTALSEKDIKSLYNNNAYIDENNRIYREIR